jgi:hypothetical protein
MRSMGSPKLDEGGQVLDPGVDLNMEGGLAEHAKVFPCYSYYTKRYRYLGYISMVLYRKTPPPPEVFVDAKRRKE